MFQILEATCSSPALAVTLRALKKIMGVIQIIGPILLIVSLSIQITQLLANPDDKKLPKKIFNSILAIILLFFIPVFINIIMKWMGSTFTVSACWDSVQ